MFRAMKRGLPSSLANNRPKKAKLTTKQKSDKHKMYEDAIDRVCSQSQKSDSTSIHNSSTSSANNDSQTTSNLFGEISKLMKVTQELQQSIKAVNSKVDIIMSFLGLSEKRTATTSDHKQDQEGTQQPSNQPSITPAASADVVVDIHHQTRTNTLKGQIRHTVLSTVYENQLIKEKRANSVVIKGLDHIDSQPLQQLVSHFLEAELGVNAEITHCKLLGHPTRGKVQPILAVLSNVDEANKILSVAKNLRQSLNPYTAQCVYIGPNLTASEAQAEYQLRCRRRERAAQQQAQRDASQNVAKPHDIAEHHGETTTSKTCSVIEKTAEVIDSYSLPTASTLIFPHANRETSVGPNISDFSSSNQLAPAIPSTSRASEEQSSA